MIDEYSLHKFIIRNGITIDNTPEFISYKRTFSTRWGEIMKIIKILEKKFSQFPVPFALIDGKKVSEIALDEFTKLKISDLLTCVINQEQVQNYLTLPSRMFKGKNGKEVATLCIQKNYKMFKARSEFKKIIFFKKCAKVINTQYQLYRIRCKFKLFIKNKDDEELVVINRKNGMKIKKDLRKTGKK